MFFEILQHFFMISHIGGGSFPKPLSTEDETHYIRLYNEGSSEEKVQAKNKLIEHNLRLVAHIVRKFNHAETEDLISIGTIGLIKGIASYKPEKKVRLATYASRCIENEILMYMRSKRRQNNEVPLDGPVGNDKDGNPVKLLDMLDNGDADMSDAIFLKDRVQILYSILDTLDDRERQIIERRYGLGNHDEATQMKISKELKISRSYVSRLEKKVLGDVRRQILDAEEKT